MTQSAESSHENLGQLENQQKNEKMDKVMKQIDSIIKEPQTAEKLPSLLNTDLKNTLKDQKEQVSRLLDSTKKIINTQLDESDKSSLQNFIDFLEPIAKEQNLNSLTINTGNAEGYNTRQGADKIKQTKDFIETQIFTGKDIILKALSNPSKQNIVVLQKFLYENLEDQNIKANLKNSSFGKKGNWDGGFGDKTAKAITTFVQEAQSDIQKADNIVLNNIHEASSNMSEKVINGMSETTDIIDGTKLNIVSVGENGLLKSRDANIVFTNGLTFGVNGEYINGKIVGGELSFPIFDKRMINNIDASIGSADIQIDNIANKITMKTKDPEALQDIEKILKGENKRGLIEFVKIMGFALSGDGEGFMNYFEEKAFTKDPLIKNVGITLGNTEYYPIETNDANPLKLTNPEKGYSLDNISGTGKIRVTTPEGIKFVQFVDGKIV